MTYGSKELVLLGRLVVAFLSLKFLDNLEHLVKLFKGLLHLKVLDQEKLDKLKCLPRGTIECHVTQIFAAVVLSRHFIVH